MKGTTTKGPPLTTGVRANHKMAATRVGVTHKGSPSAEGKRIINIYIYTGKEQCERENNKIKSTL